MIAFVAQLVNVALALLLWLILGRMVLSALVGDRPNFFLDVMRRPTDPLFRVVGRALPASLSRRLVPWISLALLLALRVALLPLLTVEGA